MKTRTLFGGAIVAAVVAGGYLVGLFPNLGIGPGNGTGNGQSSGPASATVPVSNAVPPHDAAGSSQVLHVRIDGREYSVVNGSAAIPVPLEQLVEQARRRTGDSQGIRVRVSRTAASKTTAEIQLRDALVAAGVPEEAIDWQDGPRP